MKLFLAAEAKHPDSFPELEKFVGGFEGKSIAYIPTAANGETEYGSWKSESSTWDLLKTLNAHVTPVVLEEYRDSSVLETLRGKDVIWFAGGQPGYLLYWIRRCQIDKHIKELMVDTGSIYVGSSAGSMVATPSITVSEWYMGEGEYGAGIIPGLNLVDFEIFPHYEDSMRPEIEKFNIAKKLCLLKNGEAVIVDGGEVRVFGEERFIQ